MDKPRRLIKNQTDLDIYLKIFVRKGIVIPENIDILNMIIPARNDLVIEYGDKENPYLNGIEVYIRNSNHLMAVGYRVKESGTILDDYLNKSESFVFLSKNNLVYIME